jgi:hypothetical protein
MNIDLTYIAPYTPKEAKRIIARNNTFKRELLRLTLQPSWVLNFEFDIEKGVDWEDILYRYNIYKKLDK